MLTVFTPPPIKQEEPSVFTPPPIKQEEPVRIKTEPMGPDTPWAMQAVTVQPKPEEPATLLRVEPVHKPKVRYPWEREEPAARRIKVEPPEKPARRVPSVQRPVHHPSREPQHAPPSWDQRPAQATKETAKPGGGTSKGQAPLTKHVSSANYAAVEAGQERYGLIDEGRQPGGRALLIHVRKRSRPPFALLNAVRPGAVLQVKRFSGRSAGLRVRATTPARYYSPGSLVTTLGVLVDEADWQSLTAVVPRI
jgi:hypothetical protein